MGYAKEIVIRARGILARQRADRESENASRQAEAYRRVPRLRELDKGLRSTMAMAAQAVFAQGADMEETMNRAREENKLLQQERKALLEANFPAGWLDENPACPHCGDTGYIGSNMCKCLRELCTQEQRKTMGAAFRGGERFETFRLDYYPDTVLPQLKTPASAVVVTAIRVVIIFFAVAQGIQALSLSFLSMIVSDIMYYVPILVKAAAILLAAVIGANLAETAVCKICSKAAKITKIAIYVVAGFMTVSQLGISTKIVETTFVYVVGALAVAFALAFGLGGKDYAKKILDKLDKEEK